MYGIYQVGIACCFHVFDLLTGIIGAVREHNLESGKMRDGLFKKVGFLCCYTLAILLDTQAVAIGLTLKTFLHAAMRAMRSASARLSCRAARTVISPMTDWFR